MGQSPDSSSYNETNGTSFLQGCSEFGQKTPNSRIFTNRPNKIARKNSILISVRAPVGTTNLADKDYCIGRGLASIYEINNISTNEFLRYTIQHSIPLLLQKAQGSTFEAINSNDLKQLKVYCPDLPTQKRIAKILSTVDGQIEKTEAIIAKYQAIKQGMLHDLFTRGIDLVTGKLRPIPEQSPELYKPSPLGLIPKDWGKYIFDDLINEYFDYRGKTPLKLGLSWGNGDIKALSANNVEMGRINFDKECYLGSDKLYSKWMHKGDCNKGDVIMTMEAPLGNVAQVPDNKKYILSQRTILFKTKSNIVNNDFLFEYLQYNDFQKQLYQNSSGTTALGIQQKRLAKIDIIIPPIDEQKVISDKLKSMTKIISNEMSNLNKLQKMKHGLMSRLLQGK